jgi:hypothetical protein
VLAPLASVFVVEHVQLKLWEQEISWLLELSKEEMGRLVQLLGVANFAFCAGTRRNREEEIVGSDFRFRIVELEAVG